MATREIRTLVSLDGEKEFQNELKAAGRELRVLGSELKNAAAEFENTGNKQDFLTKKSAILKKELTQQEKVVKELEKAAKLMADHFGEGSKEADEYAIQLNTARTKAEKMRKELTRTERELADVGNEMDDATKDTKQLANALRNDLEDGASEAQNSLSGLVDELREIKNMEGLQLGIDIAEGAWDMLQSLIDFANEQRVEIRENRLTDARAIAAGYDPETIQSMIRNATAITGDMEASRSAYGMLTAIPGMSEAWLKAWSDMLLGADLKIPELTFDAMAEGLQETLSNRVLAGPFLELLERSGYNEAQVDLINEQLKAARTLEEAMNVVMTPLATADVVEGGGSYAEFLRRFMVENEDIIKAEEAQTKLADAMTKLAEELLPITTFLTGTLADFIALVTSTLKGAAETIGGNETIAGIDRQELARENMMKGGVMSPDDSPVIRTDFRDAFTNIVDGLFRGGKTKEEKQLEYLESIGALETLTEVPAPDTTDAIEAIQEVGTELDTLEEDASTAGANVGANLSTSIDSSTAAAVASAQGLADQVSAALNSIAVPNVGAMMQAAMAGGNMLAASGGISVMLNGRKVGQLITPTVSTQQARSVRT